MTTVTSMETAAIATAVQRSSRKIRSLSGCSIFSDAAFSMACCCLLFDIADPRFLLLMIRFLYP